MRMLTMLGLLVASSAAPVLAQKSPAVEADLRCVAVLAAATGSTEGDVRMQMAAAVMYFIGRVDGEAPGTDLKAELKRIVPTLTPQTMTEDGKRCGSVLLDKGTMLQDLGKELQGNAQPSTPPAGK